MSDAQLIAAGMPVAIDAPYSSTYDPLMQDPAYNPSAVTSSMLSQPQATAPASNGFFTGLGGLQGLGGLNDALNNSPLGALTGSNNAASAGKDSFWKWAGSPARIGITVVGGLMIAAGIFALSRGSGVVINMPAGAKGSTESGHTGHANQTLHVKF